MSGATHMVAVREEFVPHDSQRLDLAKTNGKGIGQSVGIEQMRAKTVGTGGPIAA